MAIKHTVLMINDGITLPQLKDEVKVLQDLLKKFHALDEKEPTDGLFGSKTQEAVKSFQGKRTLQVDGIVGRKTWAALLELDPSEIELDPRPEVTFGNIPPETSFPSEQFKNELKEIEHREYKLIIDAAATEFGLQPSLIAGIGSRESSWGLILRPDGPTGTGDFNPPLLEPGLGHGRGLMQIDDRAFPDFIASGKWQDAKENIRFGCKVLSDNRKFFQPKIDGAGSLFLRATVAAYNAGPGNVLTAIHSHRDVDFFTANRNYSKDVIDRAGWYRKFAGWN